MSYSLALGPFHPAWRGPQRLILRVDGERIADLEYRDGYNERGIADRLARLDLPQALYLASRVCGTCSFAHSLAFCQAIESLCGLEVGERAAMLRVAAAELERIGSHLLAAAMLLESLGLEQAGGRLRALREQGLGLMARVSGARLAPDLCVPGGVRRNLAASDREEVLIAVPKLNRGLYALIESLIDQRSLLARAVNVGALPKTAAEQYGVRGPLARASGIARDLRADHPYAAYNSLPFRVITQDGGDIYARLLVLLLEAFESVKLVELGLQNLPMGDWQGEIPRKLQQGQASAATEGPRGLIRYTIESDGERLKQVRIDAPRQLDRLLARTMLAGALLDNAVPIIASCDVCTACAEQ
ncbi:NADH-quinone oxidoreductase subunit D [Chloroflexia bacterium SDU3-3]|nr:NADH-quinone oxidoreductase subunit D [Chloroflexia bacterium SDU3-3]